MKKILSMLIFALVMLSSLLANTASAYEFQNYLWGNKNFIMCGAHMGCAAYIDKSSIVIEKYNPPVYKLAFIVVWVPNIDKGNSTPAQSNVYHYYYNWDQRCMYEQRTNGTWRYIPPVGSLAQTGHFFLGEMAFYIAYNKKFYGGREWYDPEWGSYSKPNWSNKLYDLIDNAR